MISAIKTAISERTYLQTRTIFSIVEYIWKYPLLNGSDDIFPMILEER